MFLVKPTVLRRCWLGGRKGIRPVKTEWWGAGLVICLERGADLHMAYPGSPGIRAIKRVCVFLLVFYSDIRSRRNYC